MTTLKTSLEIAQEATLRPIMDVATEMGLEEDEVDLYGKYKAKISLGAIDRLTGAPDAKIVCVSAITPTKAGEGKTTTSVSLTQGLGHIGKRPVLCLREPSLGPIFGIKGGAAGGGYTQVVPMEDLNLHFTGDFHADRRGEQHARRVHRPAHLLRQRVPDRPAWRAWRRAVDMNDRNLRNIVTGLGGPTHGHPARDRLRHRRRLRDHGDHGHGHLAAGPAQADRLDHGRLRRRRQPGHRRADGLRRRDDGAAQGRAQAQPDPDARGPAVLHAHRPVRQHRPRQQLDHRRPGSARSWATT